MTGKPNTGCFVFCSQALGQLPAPVRAAARGAYVVAVDGGLANARRLGLEPALWVGDGDSAPAAQVRRLACLRLNLPREKEYTDLEYALGAAGEAYVDGHWRGGLTILGAQGGRLDHELGNLLAVDRWLAGLAARVGCQAAPSVTSIGPRGTWHAVVGEARFRAARGQLFSVLVFGPSPPLTISGARYNLKRARLGHASQGLSNEGMGREVVVRAHQPDARGGGARPVFVLRPPGQSELRRA